jgi:predicted glycoside hydrolase/deacetylase ChbG (UPF0249 family)
MPKQLIVSADDLGLSIPTNLAIGRAFDQGIVTSASLMPNMPAFTHAVETIAGRHPSLGIGIHLCLTSGRPVSKPEEVATLVDAAGRFRLSFVGLASLLRSRRGAETRAQIRRELEAQIDQVDAAGILADHLDSHQHVHLIPEILDLVIPLARARRLPIRCVAEPLGPLRLWWRRLSGSLSNGGLLKWLLLNRLSQRMQRRCPDLIATQAFFGVLDTGRLTLDAFRRILQLLPTGATEINVHPGFALERCDALECSTADQRFRARPERVAELAALLAPSLRAELLCSDVRLVRFRDLLTAGIPPSRVRAG